MRAEIKQFRKQIEANPDNSLRTNASIVNISAAQGLASEAGFPAYCAAAHAIVGASKATAMDYLKHGIRINCVCPGSESASNDSHNAERRTESTDKSTLSKSPSGRYITSNEVANAVVFLLGEGASAITGIQLPVDGGWSLYHH